MHINLAFIFPLIFILVDCRSRGEIPTDSRPDQLQPNANNKPSMPPQDNSSIPSDRNQDGSTSKVEQKKVEEAKPLAEKTEPGVEVKADPIIIVPVPEALPRIEAFVFTHANLCLQLEASGTTSLQTCKEQTASQKFLFIRSLDGQYQFKNSGSQLCLTAGTKGLLVTLLRGESCALKASQFFSIIDYGSVYSLKLDSINACIDAENSGVIVGTRLILYRCAAVANQKILTVKKL